MKKAISIFLCLFCGNILAQQDPQYSQYMFNQVILNPAYAGSKDAISIKGSVRKDWIGIDGAPQTGNLSISGPIRLKNMSLGAHITQESIGPKQWLGAYLDYAYRVKLGKGKLSFGLSAGLVNYRLDISKFNLYDKDEPVLYNNGITNASCFDLGAGAYYYSRSFFLSLSSTHLTAPDLYKLKIGQADQSFYSLDRHFFFSMGKAFDLNGNVVFSPSVLLKSVGASNINADINANFLIREKLWLGVSYRTSSSVVGLAQLLITDRLKIGYSYDCGIKGISRYSYGSHEIMISYDFLPGRSRIITSRFL